MEQGLVGGHIQLDVSGKPGLSCRERAGRLLLCPRLACCHMLWGKLDVQPSGKPCQTGDRQGQVCALVGQLQIGLELCTLCMIPVQTGRKVQWYGCCTGLISLCIRTLPFHWQEQAHGQGAILQAQGCQLHGGQPVGQRIAGAYHISQQEAHVRFGQRWGGRGWRRLGELRQPQEACLADFQMVKAQQGRQGKKIQIKAVLRGAQPDAMGIGQFQSKAGPKGQRAGQAVQTNMQPGRGKSLGQYGIELSFQPGLSPLTAAQPARCGKHTAQQEQKDVCCPTQPTPEASPPWGRCGS